MDTTNINSNGFVFPVYIHGYEIDLQKSKATNRSKLKKHLSNEKKNFFFILHKNNFFLKKAGAFDLFFGCLVLFFTFILYREGIQRLRDLAFFGFPFAIFFGKYILIDLYLLFTNKDHSACKELEAFYQVNWLKILMQPSFEVLQQKIPELKTFLNDLCTKYEEATVFSEQPNLSPNILAKSKQQIQYLKDAITVHKIIYDFYVGAEEQFFALQQQQQTEQVMQTSFQQITQTKEQTINKKQYAQQVKEIHHILLKASIISIDIQNHQQTIHLFKQQTEVLRQIKF